MIPFALDEYKTVFNEVRLERLAATINDGKNCTRSKN